MTQEQINAINNAVAEIDRLEARLTKRRIVECLAVIETTAGVVNGWATAQEALLSEQRNIIQTNEG